MHKRILLAYDGSEAGQKALLECGEIARWSHAELYLVAVMPAIAPILSIDGGILRQPDQEAIERQYARILDAGLTGLANLGYTARGEVVAGEPGAEITGHARRIGADLIVVGHEHQKRWTARWWRGLTSGSLIEHAPCSLLVVITNAP